MFVVIVGCGRSGAYIANRMSREGHHLVVIDSSSDAFENLSPVYSGFRIEGDATEMAVLSQAKMDKADLVVATTADDNVNLMVAQIANKILGVPKVVARVFKPEREKIYQTLGIDTLCPTTLFGDLVGDLYLEPASTAPAGGDEDKS